MLSHCDGAMTSVLPSVTVALWSCLSSIGTARMQQAIMFVRGVSSLMDI